MRGHSLGLRHAPDLAGPQGPVRCTHRWLPPVPWPPAPAATPAQPIPRPPTPAPPHPHTTPNAHRHPSQRAAVAAVKGCTASTTRLFRRASAPSIGVPSRRRAVLRQQCERASIETARRRANRRRRVPFLAAGRLVTRSTCVIVSRDSLSRKRRGPRSSKVRGGSRYRVGSRSRVGHGLRSDLVTPRWSLRSRFLGDASAGLIRLDLLSCQWLVRRLPVPSASQCVQSQISAGHAGLDRAGSLRLVV